MTNREALEIAKSLGATLVATDYYLYKVNNLSFFDVPSPITIDGALKLSDEEFDNYLESNQWNVVEFGGKITPNKQWPIWLLEDLCSILWYKSIRPLAKKLENLGCYGDDNKFYTINSEDDYAPLRVWFRVDYAGIEFHPGYCGLKKVRYSKEFSAQDIAEALPIIEEGIAKMKEDVERLSNSEVDFSKLPIIAKIIQSNIQ